MPKYTISWKTHYRDTFEVPTLEDAGAAAKEFLKTLPEGSMLVSVISDEPPVPAPMPEHCESCGQTLPALTTT